MLDKESIVKNVYGLKVLTYRLNVDTYGLMGIVNKKRVVFVEKNVFFMKLFKQSRENGK